MDGWRSRAVPGTVLGLLLPDQCLIMVNREQSRQSMRETLLHEMVHLFDENLSEEEVEREALALSRHLTPSQLTFLDAFL